MKFDIKDAGAHNRSAKITVEAEELSRIENVVLKELQRETVIPGFRKGRVPVNLLKKRHADLIKAEIIEKSIAQYYDEALKKADVHPISQGKITNVNFESVQSGLEFEVTFEVEPEIELKKYKGLKAEKEIPEVTDELVDKILTDLQKSCATVKSMEIIEEGHYVNFTAQLLGDGDVPIVGRKYDDMNVQIGSGEFDLELEKQLIGLKENEDAIVRKSNPASSDANPETAPRTENYKVVINSIEERELPPLDDELAKNLQQNGIETFPQLKEKIIENLKTDLEGRSNQQLNRRLIDELLKENTFEVPESMVENYLENLISQMKHQNQDDLDETFVRQQYKPEVIHNIRWHLLKQRLIEVEDIKVLEAEIVERIESALSPEQQQLKDNEFVKNSIKNDLLEEKVLNFLKENAEITDIFPRPTLDVTEKTSDKIK